MKILWILHSLNRYAVLGAALVLALACLSGLSTQRPGPRGARVLGAIFVGFLDLQLLLGLALYATGGFVFSRRLAEHVGVMIVAIGFAHGCHVMGRKRPGGTYRWPLVGSVGALALITFGIHAIGRGLLVSSVSLSLP